MGYKVDKISASSFYMSDKTSQRVAASVASSWNSAVNILNTLCQGKDWILFSKVFIPFHLSLFAGLKLYLHVLSIFILLH